MSFRYSPTGKRLKRPKRKTGLGFLGEAQELCAIQAGGADDLVELPLVGTTTSGETLERGARRLTSRPDLLFGQEWADEGVEQLRHDELIER